MSILDPTPPAGTPLPLVDLDDITPDESLLAEVRKTRITTPLTRILLALMVLSLGFFAGALVDRWQRSSSSSTPNLQSLAAQFRGGGGGPGTGASGASGTGTAGGGTAGFPGGSNAGGGATIGTVKLVDGTNVYVQDRQGNVVKVATDPDTKVTISKTGTVSDLEPGSAVIVQGKQSSDGTSMAATSITPSAGLGLGGGGPAAGGNGG